MFLSIYARKCKSRVKLRFVIDYLFSIRTIHVSSKSIRIRMDERYSPIFPILHPHIFVYNNNDTNIYNFVLWNNKKRKKRKKIESDLVKSLSLHNVNLYLKSSYWTQHRPQTWYRVIYSICINSNSRSNCLSKSKLGELKLLQQTQTWGQFIENSKNSFNYLIIYQSYIRS